MHTRYPCVLVVDDDPVVSQILASYFAKQGTTSVLIAANGAKGKALVDARDDIDLIVSDLHMPDVNGIEFVEHLKEVNCTVPLVIISSADKSAVDAAGLLASAHRLNYVGAVSKPVNFGLLSDLLGLYEFS